MSKTPHGNPLAVLLLALAALAVLSMLPWSTLTGHRFKDFSLISDLLPPPPDMSFVTREELDPALAELPPVQADADTAVTAAPDSASRLASAPLPDDFTPPRAADGTVLLEDYSGGSALPALRKAFSEAPARLVRVAVIGDSYIEGDIFTQDVRSLLQQRYGGRGVGYMAAHSDFPGFRQSVRQTSSGWTERDMRHVGSDPLKPLSGVYHAASSGATVTYKGAKRPPLADSWDCSRVLFIAPSAGDITLTTDGGSVTHTVAASPDVQSVALDGHTARLSVATSVPGLKFIGAWLDTPAGVSLDCMSMRGNSGLTHASVSDDVARQSRRWIDYDLIVFEFGINALSSAQKDYSSYASAMVRAVEKVRSQYPSAQILVLGIGDRGQKRGGAFASMATAPAMVRAQRDIARRTRSLFWDTRAAMGGADAVVSWHDRSLVNADYVHLNHKGGAELARIFVNSLFLSIGE